MSESYSVEAVLSLVDSSFTTGIARAEKSLSNLTKGTVDAVGDMGKSMTKTGAALTLGVTTPLTKLGKSIFDTGREFDSVFNSVRSVADETGVSFEDLRKQAIQLGADSVFGATDVAEAMEMMGSAGFGTKEIFDSMPGVIDLAAASGGNMALAAEVAATALHQFGLDMSDTTHVADVFAEVAAATNAGISDMGEAMKYAGPVAGSLGLSIEETSAAIGIMSNAGIKGSQAGTTLQRALTNLASPSKQAAAYMTDWGWSAFDATGKMKPLSQIIPELRDNMSGLTDEQKQQAISTLFGQHAMSGMLALVNSAPGEFQDLTQALIESDGAAKTMADTLMEGLPGAWEELGGSLETAKLELYDLIEGPISSIIKSVSNVVDAFSELSDAQQKQILKWGAMAAAVGPALTVLGGFTSLVSGTMGNVLGFASALGSVGSGFISTAVSGAGLISKLGIMQWTVGLLGSGFMALVGKISALSGVTPLISQMGSLFTSVGTQATIGTGKAIAGLAQLGLAIVGPVAAIGVFVAAVGLLGSFFYDEIMNMIDFATNEGPSIISGLADGIISALPTLMATGINILTGFANALAANIPTIIQKGVEIIIALVQGVQAGLPQIISSAINIVTSLVTSLILAIPQLMLAGMQFILALVQGIVANIPQIMASAQQIISTFQFSLSTALPLIISTGIQIILNLIQGLAQALPGIISAAAQIIVALVQAIMSNLPQVIVGGVNIIIALVQAILGAIPQIITSAGKIISALVRGVISNLPQILLAGIKIVFELIKGMIQAVPAITQAVGKMMVNIGKSIVDGIMDIGGKVQDWWGSNMPEWLGGGAEEAADRVTTEMQGMANDSISIMDSMTSSMDASFEELIGNLQTNANEASNAIPAEFETMEFDIEGVFSNLDSNIISSMQNIETGAVNSAEFTSSGIISAFGPLASEGVIPYETMGASVQNSMMGLNSTIPLLAENTSSGIISAFGPVATDGLLPYQLMSSGIQSNLQGLNTSLPMLANSTASGVVLGSQQVEGAASSYSIFAENSKAAVSGISIEIPNEAKVAATGVTNASDRVSTAGEGYNAMESVASNAMRTMNQNVRTQMEAIKSSIARYGEGMKNTFNNSWLLISADVKSNVATIKTDVSSGMSSIKSNISSTMANIKSKFTSGWNSIKATTSSGISNMGATVSNGMSRIVYTVASSMSRATSAMRSAAGQAYSAGYQMGAGFLSGLNSMSGAIIGRARAIANAAAAAMRSALAIRSPSKVTTEIGEMTGLGPVVGMENMIPKVKKMAEKYSKALIPKVPEAEVNSVYSADRRFATSSQFQEVSGNSLELHLTLGNHDFVAHVRDITRTQEAELRLSF